MCRRPRKQRGPATGPTRPDAARHSSVRRATPGRPAIQRHIPAPYTSDSSACSSLHLPTNGCSPGRTLLAITHRPNAWLRQVCGWPTVGRQRAVHRQPRTRRATSPRPPASSGHPCALDRLLSLPGIDRQGSGLRLCLLLQDNGAFVAVNFAGTPQKSHDPSPSSVGSRARAASISASCAIGSPEQAQGPSVGHGTQRPH